MRYLAILLSLWIPALSADRWDTEYWQYLNWTQHKDDKYRWYAEAELRVNRHLGTLYYYRIAECFAYKASDCIDLEAHYSFVYDRSIGRREFRNTSRFELECNPHFDLTSTLSYNGRNRIEFLKEEYDPQIKTIYRHRSRFRYALQDAGKLKAIQCGNEIFIDLFTNEFTQNRFVPIILTVELNKKDTVDLFFMIRNFRSAGLWRQSAVLGSTFNF